MTINWDWPEVEAAVEQLIHNTNLSDLDVIVGIEYGGIIPAMLVQKHSKGAFFETIHPLVHSPKEIFDRLCGYQNILFIDDINDSGETLSHLAQLMKVLFGDNDIRYATWTMVKRQSSQAQWAGAGIKVDHDEWFTFPWEKDEKMIRDRDALRS